MTNLLTYFLTWPVWGPR